MTVMMVDNEYKDDDGEYDGNINDDTKKIIKMVETIAGG